MRRVALVALLCALPGAAIAGLGAWRLSIDRSGAHLTDALPDSDDVATAFHCDPGEKLVHVYATIGRRLIGAKPPPWPATLTMTSGTLVRRVPARAMPDEETGGTDLEAVIAAADPLMTAVAKTGQLKLAAAGEPIQMRPIPATKAARFVHSCGG